MTNKKKGFTLIELMIVVAIIGILAAIAIPNFIKFQAKGKQAEANSNLKGIFSAQKATFSPNNGYWSDIGAIGFQPERGNRYLYDLGPVAMDVASGTQGACGQLQSRAAALIPLTANDCGIGVDSVRHGNQFLDATILALMTSGTATFTSENTNPALVATMAGVNGAACPNCDFAARAKSNVDNDDQGDEWWISSQTIETIGVVGCPPAMTIANMTAYTSGSPAPVNDDVCAQ
ncbi:MAG: prepilin-type N-terminal cleavage/methylation domain-containing protein [Myxococcus sp.]|nr:prepilin-type N-terminal cleavage/methylation domain-containing protein [Myxococcus sp.]